MLKGAMRGRTMFVIPYIMGPPDSPLTKVGFEITDSIYVVLSMRIMTRMGEIATKRLGDDREGGMESRRAFVARRESGAALDLSFPAGQHHHLGRFGLRRQCFAEQEMSGAAHRFVSRAQTRLAGRAHVDPRRRVAGRRKALRRGGVPERMRQNEFRHAHSAETFQRLESHDRRRRHRVDADSRWPFVCGESGERIFRRRAGHELQIEPERDEIDRARHAIYKRRADR